VHDSAIIRSGGGGSGGVDSPCHHNHWIHRRLWIQVDYEDQIAREFCPRGPALQACLLFGSQHSRHGPCKLHLTCLGLCLCLFTHLRVMSSRPVQRHRQMVRIPSWKQHHRLQWKTTGAAAWQSPRMRKTYPLVFVKWFVQRDHVLKWGLCITAYQNDISKKHQTTTNSQTGRERKGVCPKKRQGSWIALADFKGATSEFNCNVNCQHEESAVWGPSKYPEPWPASVKIPKQGSTWDSCPVSMCIYMYIYIYYV
jgi:hypothetical protein